MANVARRVFLTLVVAGAATVASRRLGRGRAPEDRRWRELSGPDLR